MTNPANASIETTQAAIKARWGFDSSKTDLPFKDSSSMEKVVEHLTETYSSFYKALARVRVKFVLLKQRMQNATLHNFIARLMPCKSQASRSHRSVTKSSKSMSSSSDGDSSDPDPETLSAPLKSLYSLVQSVNSLLQIAFFARISVNEVAK
ncbi:hypothetical protein GBF49_04670 [Salmonella enterica subsp. enterica]|nr:hypothetical protein [Salmonella enterica]EDB3271213.1 hypothetical protein [Salmonella enterica subsp. enterica serovar Javiana]EDE9843498.1 hypothetical protein [Salmonella enterica subsp. enterica serovar Javiana]EHM5193756.1 hypothetical protein [Salmonella enterica]ELX6966817.1 hypothetical protein [Salmonella enterica]